MTSSEGPQTSRQALRASRLLVKRWRAPSRWWSTGKHTRCLVIYIIWVPSLRMEILENPQGSHYDYVEAKLIILQGWKLLWLSMLSSSSWIGMDVTQSWCWVWSSRSSGARYLILLGSSWSGARYVHRKLAHGAVAGFQDGQRPLQQVLRGSHRDLNWFYI